MRCNSNCQCKNTPCTCASKAIPVAPPCEQGTVDCPGSEPCGEVFSAECIVYTGDTILDVGIQKYDRLDAIIQRLVLLITSPGCIIPTALCQAVVDLQSTYISSTIIKISWLPNDTATAYTVYYRETAGVWYQLPVQSPAVPTVATIMGLATGTDYEIKVLTTCASGGPCSSVTILVTTLD